MRRRSVAIVLALGLGLDLLSFIAWARPVLATPAALAVLAGIAVLAFRDLRWGVTAVLLELLWGSHGYLLRIPLDGIDVSLRVGVFLLVLAATIWRLRTNGARRMLVAALRTHPARWPVLAFLCTLAYACIFGLARHAFDRVFFDANAWGFLLLAPTFLLVRIPTTLFLAGAMALIVRTYLLLFLFSHDLGGLWFPLYEWIRDTRLGEVTMFAGAFPRVFLPSMVLLFPAVMLAIARMGTNTMGEGERMGVEVRRLSSTLFGGGIAALLLSLSRSYWMGLALLAGLGVVAALQRMLRHERLPWRTMRTGTLAIIGGLALAVAIVHLPYPAPLTTAGVGETLLARFASDAAVANRWQQLSPLWAAIRRHPILGSGFGATVTYTSRDPRTLTAYPDGRYTTHTFEWGYLDDWLERGLVGLLVELWLIGALIVHGLFRRGGETVAWSLALLAIAIVHATSPYLNHPIGIGVMLLAFAVTVTANVRSPSGIRIP